MNSHQLEPKRKEVKNPNKFEKFTIRSLIIIGLILVLCLFNWYARSERIGFLPLYVLLSISLFYKSLKILFEWYHYWSIKVESKPRENDTAWKVDMLTTAMPGEPFEMIEATLIAMVAVKYPHTTYLCDEGNDPKLKVLCHQLGVIHKTRVIKIDAKAGNINNTLKSTTGEICVILDPDHQPSPDFLDEVLPYFSNEEIGFVQIVQAYINGDENHISRGAAQQTYAFYGPMMMAMSNYGTAQAIGANCTFRRKALDSIGGHAAGLSEDMHTSMQLHAAGWKSVYVPKILTRGLVPSDLAAYYKQQLKWSRGTFELLFTVYPKLFTKFTWRQKLHYLIMPLHFASGLICFIDICIPIVCLISANTPLKFTLHQSYSIIFLLIGFITLIRQYSQKWYHEKNELGFHLSGGILLFTTWWIHLTGLVYTFSRIKIPYIPTPKYKSLENNLLLNIPNLILFILCIAAASYGLYEDWNPYNFFLAGYALINAFMLSTTLIVSQQLWIMDAKSQLNKVQFIRNNVSRLKVVWNFVFGRIYSSLRNGAGLYAICLLMIIFVFSEKEEVPHILDNYLSYADQTSLKDAPKFYTGIQLPTIKSGKISQEIINYQTLIHRNINILSIYQPWDAGDILSFPHLAIDTIIQCGSIPMITWDPWPIVNSTQASKFAKVTVRSIIKDILDGCFDNYIKEYALEIRKVNSPIIIRFANELDTTIQHRPALLSSDSPESSKLAWKRVIKFFSELGVDNVTWVYSPCNLKAADNYYPGNDFVDWIGASCLNYGTLIPTHKWQPFKSIYLPYHEKMYKYQKPIILTSFGTSASGGNPNKWILESLKNITGEFKEIHSLIITDLPKIDDNNLSNEYPTMGSKGKRLNGNFINGQLFNMLPNNQLKINPKMFEAAKEARFSTYSISVLKGRRSDLFQLTIENKSFYIKGIEYNPDNNRMDESYPLTISQLRQDFTSIKATGCNTISRSNPTVYDRNILKVANEYNLKLLYGFTFDPEIDYYSDVNKVDDCIREVENQVAKYKDNPSILCWNINTSNILRKGYADRPYFFLLKTSYMKMINEIINRIHSIDHEHPVIVSINGGTQLASLTYETEKLIPSMDILGISNEFLNPASCYQSITNISKIKKPILITKFGYKGFVDSSYSEYMSMHDINEAPDKEKAEMYKEEWNKYISDYEGYNIGGVAYSWMDQYEGTATLCGITDFKGRKKAPYYALQKIWTGSNETVSFPDYFIVGPPNPLDIHIPYEYTLVCSDTVFTTLEWRLMKEISFNEISGIEKSTVKNKIWITIPSPGKYRLYAYLSDNKGNVTTVSKLIVCMVN